MNKPINYHHALTVENEIAWQRYYDDAAMTTHVAMTT